MKKKLNKVMAVSEGFRAAVKSYLEDRASTDELFAIKYQNKSKTLDECLNYILIEVKNMKVECLSDAEVYGLAVHYYDEEDIKVGKAPRCRVVVSSDSSVQTGDIKRKRKSEKKISPVASSIQMPLFDL